MAKMEIKIASLDISITLTGNRKTSSSHPSSLYEKKHIIKGGHQQGEDDTCLDAGITPDPSQRSVVAESTAGSSSRFDL